MEGTWKVGKVLKVRIVLEKLEKNKNVGKGLDKNARLQRMSKKVKEAGWY